MDMNFLLSAVPTEAGEVVTESFKVMGFGMGGVFVVLLVFYMVVKLLGKLFPAKEET